MCEMGLVNMKKHKALTTVSNPSLVYTEQNTAICLWRNFHSL